MGNDDEINSQCNTGAEFESANETLWAEVDDKKDDSFNISYLQVDRDTSVGGEELTKVDSCCRAANKCKDICNCEQVTLKKLKKTSERIVLETSAYKKKTNCEIFVTTNADLCNNLCDFLSSLDLSRHFRDAENEVDIEVKSANTDTNSYELIIQGEDKVKREISIRIDNKKISLTYKNGSLTKVGVEQRNVGIFFFEKFIKNPIFRLLGDPRKTGKKCCEGSLTDTRKKTSNCTICDEHFTTNAKDRAENVRMDVRRYSSSSSRRRQTCRRFRS